MQRTDLRTGWTVGAISGDRSGFVLGTYPAEVPGCVHTDLMTAGVIPDPYLDGNEAALRWMHEIDWRYATVLDPRTFALEAPGAKFNTGGGAAASTTAISRTSNRRPSGSCE